MAQDPGSRSGAVKSTVVAEVGVGQKRISPGGTAAVSVIFVGVLLLSNLWYAPGILLGTATATGDEGGDSLRQILFVLLLAGVVAIAAFHDDLVSLLRVPLPVGILLGWCWLSVIWAFDPLSSFRRITFTTIVALIISYAYQTLQYRRIMRLLVLCMIFILLLDWVAIVVSPASVHQAGEIDEAGLELDGALAGNWRGAHRDKNQAGQFAAICAIILLFETVRQRAWWIGSALVAAALAFLYFTQSKTSGGFVIIAIMVGVTSEFFFRNRSARPPMVLFAVFALAIAFFLLEDALQNFVRLFEDPSSLTGRVQIWPPLIDFAADYPLLGAGYGSFWGIGDGSPIMQYATGWVTKIFQAHNGYIDILIQTGAIGLTIVVVMLAVVPLMMLFLFPLRSDVSRGLICAVISFILLHDLLETSLVDRANPAWVVMTVMYCTLFSGSSSRGKAPRASSS
jgi:O-antigen ligase